MTGTAENRTGGNGHEEAARAAAEPGARERRRALVVGAGVGGLTAAIALRQAGFGVTVYEQAPQLREIGAGLTLWSNALQALRQVGLDAAVAALGTPIERSEFWSSRGRVLAAVDVGSLSRELGAPSVGVHRARLLPALAAALPPGTIRFQARCVGLTSDADGVIAYFEGGDAASGALLVGADGLHSVVREHNFGAQAPRYAGYTAWRGVTPFAHPRVAPGLAAEVLGRGRRFGFVQVGGGSVYWYASITAPPRGEDRGEARSRLLREFRGWPAPVEALVAATEADAILQNDIFARPPAAHWGSGRVTLLGDAAHPMTPNIGQGAAQSIEDAVVLGECLARMPHVPDALGAYEARRRGRANGMVVLSQVAGWLGQLERPAAARLRDLLLRLMPETVARRELARLLTFPG